MHYLFTHTYLLVSNVLWGLMCLGGALFRYFTSMSSLFQATLNLTHLLYFSDRSATFSINAHQASSCMITGLLSSSITLVWVPALYFGFLFRLSSGYLPVTPQSIGVALLLFHHLWPFSLLFCSIFHLRYIRSTFFLPCFFLRSPCNTSMPVYHRGVGMSFPYFSLQSHTGTVAFSAACCD